MGISAASHRDAHIFIAAWGTVPHETCFLFGPRFCLRLSVEEICSPIGHQNFTLVPQLSSSVSLGTLTFDGTRASLDGPAGPVPLRRKSFEVLRYLVEHPCRVVSKQ